MDDKNIREMMQIEITVPDIVQEKADLTFEQIRTERTYHKMKTKKINRSRRVLPLVAAAAVLTLGTTVCAAGYLKWSRGLQNEFKATEEERQMLQTEQFTAPVVPSENNSVTDAGVTVTAEQTIVTDQFAWLSFRVDGYDLDEGKEPCFDGISISIDGNNELSWSSHFYDGLQRDDYGNIFYDDGTKAEENPDGSVVERFAAEDGSLEYIIWIDVVGNDEITLTDSVAKVRFSGLGTVDKAAFTPDIEGKWELNIELKGSEHVREINLSEALGESGAVVKRVEISPISIEVEYAFEAHEIALEGIDAATGETIQTTDYEEPPVINGVRLKDGTMLTGIMNGGTTCWSESLDTYTATYTTNCIIDTEQVDAILFLKAIPDQNGPIAEDNLYIVPVE